MFNLNLNLGDYKDEPLHVYGGGFEKVNLITGMKGGGKSHITKGIISESLKSGMSAVVFDINNEYDKLPNSLVLKAGIDLKFRLDYIEAETFIRMVDRLNPAFAGTATAPVAYAKLPGIIKARQEAKHIPDMQFLKGATNQVITGNSPAEKNMQYAYERAIEVIQSSNLIMSEAEAKAEDSFITEAMKGNQVPFPSVISLRSSFMNMFNTQPQVITFQIGGLQSVLQKVIVSLVVDHLKKACSKQTESFIAQKQQVPIYPTVYFEEAHMYMDTRDIDDLIPLIRHIGINVFFVTNTPGALPDSVFRLLDNLIMTRMVNRKDIDRVADCGLTDKETIIGFAKNLKDHHALFLSAKDGATQNFPLVFHVRDFGLPKSGETRSQWKAMSESQQAQQQGNISSANSQSSTSDANSSKAQRTRKSKKAPDLS
jgi:hypothetical protein